MEIFQIRPQSVQSPKTHFMNPLFSKLNPRKFASFSSMAILNPYCTTTTTKEPLSLERSGSRNSEVRVRAKVAAEAAQLKENWLGSLTCPFPHETRPSICGGGLDLAQTNAGSDWIVGIDPDLSGALAVLKCDQSGCSAQVFDSPHLKVMVGKRIRKRLDAKSIVLLLHGFNAPIGTTAYIEQSVPYPQDGKQGWWSGGFSYGLWIGILVASGFSVVPVPSLAWKNKFQLSGCSVTKDDSRRIASTLFPSLSSSLKRKKDHGRAEALLIAEYGKGLKMKSASSCDILDELPYNDGFHGSLFLH